MAPIIHIWPLVVDIPASYLSFSEHIFPFSELQFPSLK